MRSVPLRFAGLLLAALATARGLPADILELPAELPLGADSQLLFELDDAELHLTSRADGVPVIRARVAKTGQSARLEVVSHGGSLTVRRADGEGGAAPRLRIDGMFGPGRTVRVVGGDLTVRVEDPAPASEEDAAGRIGIQLVLDGSQVDLSGVRNPRLDLTASSAVISHTSGTLALTLDGGSADVRGHRGSLELDAGGASVAVVDFQGKLTPRLSGGSLEVAGGAGSLVATAADAELYLDSWEGSVQVDARHSVLDARSSERGASWQLEGRDLRLVLEAIRATITATLEGGGLRGRDLRGRLQVMASSEASLELTDVAATIQLELSGGVEAWLTNLSGGLEAKLTDSRLTGDGVTQLELTGVRAEVTAGGIAELGKVEMNASQLSLDLRDIRHDPSLDLKGFGRTTVKLPTPCIVQLAETESLIDDAIQVTGCELRPPGHQTSRQQDRAIYGQNQPIRLTVKMSGAAEIEVEGEP